MSDSQKAAELFRRSLDAFLAQDMRAWADLCAEDVLVEFPFAPAGTPSRLDGRVAIFEYLRNYPKIIDVHDIEAGARTALATVDPTPYFAKNGENLWAAVKGFLDAVAETAAAPVIEKYTGVLGAVDVFTVPTAFSILESIRLDLGYRMDVHP